MAPVLLLLPIIAALVGWFTNFLAVKMLFHPRLPLNILGFSIQGVFPKRQKQLADKLGSLVAEELFSVKDVLKKLNELATSEESMDLVGKRIEKTIREKLVKSFPMLAMFLTDEMVEKVTNLFKFELQDFIRESAKDLSIKLEKSLDIKELHRLYNFDKKILNLILESDFQKYKGRKHNDYWFIMILNLIKIKILIYKKKFRNIIKKRINCLKSD